MITVKILADSINPAGKRLTSWLLKYPRFIHSEMMTHRVFSRNAASSRAIPLARMIEAIKTEPALPEYWSAEHKGMQAIDRLLGDDLQAVQDEWVDFGQQALSAALFMHKHGLAKSLCNRLIEPWSHITVLATATDHSNFFALRAHPAAMPEFQVLAYRMLDQYLKSDPMMLEWGEWHVPRFSNLLEGRWTTRCDVCDKEYENGVGSTECCGSLQRIVAYHYDERDIKIATARCARLSYLTFDNEIDPAKDIELHDRLLASGHMSPFEHCALAFDFENDERYRWSNFDSDEPSGWQQYRKQFENENRTKVDLTATLATKPDWIKL